MKSQQFKLRQLMKIQREQNNSQVSNDKNLNRKSNGTVAKSPTWTLRNTNQVQMQ
jgi:hypothetical protein